MYFDLFPLYLQLVISCNVLLRIVNIFVLLSERFQTILKHAS